MKVGSLVVCVRGFSGDYEAKPVIKDKIYTIREIAKDDYGDLCVHLDEVINEKSIFTNKEPKYDIERFRELDTPTEIKLENILELEIV